MSEVLLLQAAMAGPTVAAVVWLLLVPWPVVRRTAAGLVAAASLAASGAVFWFAYRGEAPVWRSFAPDLLDATVVVAAEIAVLLVALRADVVRRGVAAATVVSLGVATSAVVAAGYTEGLATHALLIPVPTLAAAVAALSGRGRQDARGLIGLAAADAVALVGLSVIYARTETATVTTSTGLGVGLVLGAAAAKVGALPGLATWRLAATGGPGSVTAMAVRGHGVVLATLAGVTMAGGERMPPLAIAAAAVILVAGAASLLATVPSSAVAAVTGTAFGLPFLALGLGGTLGVRSFLLLVPAVLLAAGAAALLAAPDPEPSVTAGHRRREAAEPEPARPPDVDAVTPATTTATEAPARETEDKRTAAKKTPAKKAPAKKAPAKKAPAKKAPAKKAPAKKTPARRPRADGSEGGDAGGTVPALIRRRKITARLDDPPAPGQAESQQPAAAAPPPRPKEPKVPRAERPPRAAWGWLAAASMGVAVGSLLGMPPGGGFPGTWLAVSVAAARSESSAGWLLLAAAPAVGLALALFAIPGLVRSARPRAVPALAGALAAGALLYAGVQPVRLALGWWIRIENALALPEVLPASGAPGLPVVGGMRLLLVAAAPVGIALLVVALARGLREPTRDWVPVAGPRRGRRTPGRVRALSARVAAPFVPVAERLRRFGIGFAVAAAVEVAALLVAGRLIVLTARAGFL